MREIEKKLLIKMEVLPGEDQTLEEIYKTLSDKLKAAIRIGKIMAKKKTEKTKVHIKTAAEAYNYMADYFDLDSGEEQIFVLLLDSRNKILSCESIGAIMSASNAIIDLRFLLKKILLSNTTGLILAHNHPTGNLNASKEDVALTKRMEIMMKDIGVSILDHIILSQSGFETVKW